MYRKIVIQACGSGHTPKISGCLQTFGPFINWLPERTPYATSSTCRKNFTLLELQLLCNAEPFEKKCIDKNKWGRINVCFFNLYTVNAVG